MKKNNNPYFMIFFIYGSHPILRSARVSNPSKRAALSPLRMVKAVSGFLRERDIDLDARPLAGR